MYSGQGPKKKEASQKRTSQSENKLPEHHRLSSSPLKERQEDVKTNPTCSCCRQPHDEYPGTDHYFDTDYNKQSSPSLSEQKTVVRDKRMSRSDARKIEEEHDDDNDVVNSGSAANKLTIIIT